MILSKRTTALLLLICGAYVYNWREKVAVTSVVEPSKLTNEVRANVTEKQTGVEDLSKPEGSRETKLQHPEPKLAILNEILAAGDDNDSRLDAELKVLNEREREEFRQRYIKIPIEKFNLRGTILFLLGRNLSTARDFNFFAQVLKTARSSSIGPIQFYPHLVILKSIERLLEAHPDGYIRARSAALIKMSLSSPIPKLALAAKDLDSKFN